VLRLFLLASALGLLLAAESQGQSWRGREAIYSSQTADGVPLQPFSFDRQPARAQAIQVAYYAPRPTRRVEPIERDEYDSEATTPRFDVGGSHPMVPGNRAVLRNGIAYAPANAPDGVKHAIWAVNSICNRPYVWGGGHGSFHDYGYDCSGTVSFALHYAGMLEQPLPSSDFLRYGERGRGRWVTIYSRHGHVFAMIAGLRLDTTDLRYGSDVGPRWHVDGRDAWGFQARHPVGL
jgi:cell wall-associated NlpC family hydrolase